MLLAVAVEVVLVAATAVEVVCVFPWAPCHQHHPSFSTCRETSLAVRGDSAQPGWMRLALMAEAPASPLRPLVVVMELAWKLVAVVGQTHNVSAVIRGEDLHCFAVPDDRW